MKRKVMVGDHQVLGIAGGTFFCFVRTLELILDRMLESHFRTDDGSSERGPSTGVDGSGGLGVFG